MRILRAAHGNNIKTARKLAITMPWFELSIPRVPALVSIVVGAMLAAGCGGGGGGGGGSSNNGGGGNPPANPGPVSGRISYDKVPFSAVGSGLDYNSVIDAPVRGAVVEAIDNANGSTILATTNTDASGNYSLSPPNGSTFFLRVKAQLLQSGSPSWNFRVVNNTNADSLYVMQSTARTYDGSAMTLNLRAASGWTGASYTQTRVAAPFSLLDVAYEMKNLIVTADATAQFASLDIHWSPTNAATDPFDPPSGAIGTTFYTPGLGVFVLGVQNVDTDEYDQHVIAHELGHYIQDVFSRDDSIGGGHGPGDLLDMRVAFSEGWGNAFAGMVKDDPRYRDSFGPAQAADFDVNVESDNFGSQGWFSEESVQSIFYDLFDAAADANDSVTLGFAPLFQVLEVGLPPTEALTSIFPFISQLRAGNPGAAAGIDAIVNSEQIVSTMIDELGSTETNPGGDATNLPIYRSASVNGGSQQVCSSIANGDEGNRLGNVRFLRFNASTQGVTIRSAGPVGSDPDLGLYRQGLVRESIADSVATGIEQFSIVLTPGSYVLAVYDFLDPDVAGSSCMTVTITSP